MLKPSNALNDVKWHLKDMNWHAVANITFQKLTQTKQFCMYKVQNNPCSASHKAGYLSHPLYVPVGQRHDPIFSLSLPASFGSPAEGYPGSSAIHFLSSEATMPLRGAVWWGGRRNSWLPSHNSYPCKVQPPCTHRTLQQMRRNVTLCWQDNTSLCWCCQELCWALTGLII